MKLADAFGRGIDRAIAVVSPVWAAKRTAARAQLHVLQKALGVRGFEARKPNRLSGRNKHKAQGPKSFVSENQEWTLKQARDLWTFNPYARGIIRSIVVNLVGAGIVPQPRVMRPKKREMDEAFNYQAEEVWNAFADASDPSGRKDFYSQQRMGQRELHIAGETLFVSSVPRDNRPIPYAVEVLPSERLSQKTEEGKAGANSIIQGVEFDAEGHVVGYWIYPNHPWDGGSYGKDREIRIPAERVLHYHDELVPGQVRGVTRLLTVASALEAFMAWLDFVLTKERVGSAFAIAILRNSMNFNSPLSTGDDDDTEDDDGNEVDYLEGGIIAHLRPGEDIKGIQSGVASQAVEQLSQVFLRVVSRGLDVPLNLLTLDYSKTTYLSSRSEEIEGRRHFEPHQVEMVQAVCRPVYRSVLDAGVRVGMIRKATLEPRHYAADHPSPPREWVDPAKDIKGAKEGIKAGLRSPMAEIVRRTGNPRKVLEDLARFQGWAEELGLNLDIFGAAPAEEPTAEELVEEAKEDSDAEAKAKENAA